MRINKMYQEGQSAETKATMGVHNYFQNHENESKIKRLILRIIKNPSEVDYVFNLVYYKTHRSVANGTFQQRAALSSWAYRIAYNESIVYLRRQAKQKLTVSFSDIGSANGHNSEHEYPADSPFNVKDAIPSPLDVLIIEEQNNALRANLDSAFAAMDNQDSYVRMGRDILQMWASSEMTYEKIASLLGIPLGTLKSSTHTAKKKLRAELSQRL